MFNNFWISLIVFTTDNEDYHILNDNPIHFGPGRKKLLSVDAVDDDIVEELKEYFKIRLIAIYDPDIYIDEARNYTEITIHDDDSKHITFALSFLTTLFICFTSLNQNNS